MLSLEQIIQNTKQKYRFNMLQIRNVFKKLPFLTGVSYFKKKRGRIKVRGLALGPRGFWGRNAGIQMGQAKFLQIKHFPPPQRCLLFFFFFKPRSKSLFSPAEEQVHREICGTWTKPCYLQAMALVRDATPRRHRSFQIFEGIFPGA